MKPTATHQEDTVVATAVTPLTVRTPRTVTVVVTVVVITNKWMIDFD